MYKRQGLRPSRYCITADGRLILSSEVGVLELDEAQILKKERLHPGKMLLVDTRKGEVLNDEEVKEHYAGAHPYGEWLDSYLVRLRQLHIPNERVPALVGEDCLLYTSSLLCRVTITILLIFASPSDAALASGTDTVFSTAGA